MITVISCRCGSSDSLARNFLHSVGFPDWASIKIYQGKEASLSITNQLPPTPEKEMLISFLKNASKWVVIIGYTDTEVRWSDISHHGPKSNIEAEFVIKSFA